MPDSIGVFMSPMTQTAIRSPTPRAAPSPGTLRNRLTQVVNPGVGITTLRFDPFGRRIQKSGPLGTTNYLYDLANIVEEVDVAGSVLAGYIQGQNIDELLAGTRSGITNYFQVDPLGSITSGTNSSAAATSAYAYDAFGNLSSSTGSITGPFRYTGRESDSETGLYYYRARYYDSQAGRFLNEDPVRFEGGDTNFYVYVRNSPTRLRDPFGLCVDKKLAKCTSSLFGVTTISFTPTHGAWSGGSFTGGMAGVFDGVGKPLLPGPYIFTVNNDAMLPTSVLQMMYTNPPGQGGVLAPGDTIGGLTPASNPFVTYTAFDQQVSEMQQTQIWELGNALGLITGRQIPEHWNTNRGPGNNEPGNALLNCYNNP